MTLHDIYKGIELLFILGMVWLSLDYNRKHAQ